MPRTTIESLSNGIKFSNTEGCSTPNGGELSLRDRHVLQDRTFVSCYEEESSTSSPNEFDDTKNHSVITIDEAMRKCFTVLCFIESSLFNVVYPL